VQRVCNNVYQGDGHGFGAARIDPSTSRIYIRIDFRDHRVTSSEHESCPVEHRSDLTRCDALGAPVIQTSGPDRTRLPPDDSTLVHPHVNIQQHAYAGGESLRLSWYGPLTGPSADTPRALSDGQIEFQADGTLRVRRTCWPDLTIDWVDRHGVRQVYRGNETNRLPPGSPIDLNAVRHKECADTGNW
jgi:hypothetical protein